jgi:fatty-acyl-CoA synthase
MGHKPVYLWTLPLFHCNGWTFPWTIAAVGGTNVCLRRVEAAAMLDAIREHKVTHMCGAPIVYSLLVGAPEELRTGITHKVAGMIAASAPPPSLIEGCERIGIELTHVYGLTEVYGPAAVCAVQEDWAGRELHERASLLSRQGVTYPLQEGMAVIDPDTMQPVPRDGTTMGEIMFRGNITMKGYLKNPATTALSFAGGWYHTGDLAVAYPDGYVKIQDRSKDIIISGGENISSLEVEETLYRHPAVMYAAVVAQPDEKWGETPCAVIELKPGMEATEAEIIEFCRARMARFKVPRRVVFRELPKTSTGKIQKHVLRQAVREG